ncbi:PIGK [Mytilus edulis]|uniref:PIGK n=1 Tax=Mytilus edulis TaxID=6550 RepID=A0A8S3TU29_MYTED|nr:PIGK [Mytilus edulis]
MIRFSTNKIKNDITVRAFMIRFSTNKIKKDITVRAFMIRFTTNKIKNDIAVRAFMIRFSTNKIKKDITVRAFKIRFNTNKIKNGITTCFKIRFSTNKIKNDITVRAFMIRFTTNKIKDITVRAFQDRFTTNKIKKDITVRAFMIRFNTNKIKNDITHHVDSSIGVYVIDRYTYYALEFLDKVTPDSKKTMGQFLKVCPKNLCISTVATRTDLFARDPNKVLLTDFFGSVRNVEPLAKTIKLLNKTDQCTKDSCQDKIQPEDQDLEPLSYAEQFPMPK